ncbi:MAG: L,D-transpeptidase family protein [Geobacteraceae bacterium]|nr:L,D-transpeptidase family protein [Geobacteraceae bacterium]
MFFSKDTIPQLIFRVAILLFLGSVTPSPGFSFEQQRTALLPGTDVQAGQLIVVVDETLENSKTELYTFEKSGKGWQKQCGPLPAMIGWKGLAPPGEKREGDGRTPSGLYPLEFAFGYAGAIDSKMPYRQSTENDLWVDDPNAPDYNTWVKRGQTGAASFESMKLNDHRYRVGISIGYNRSPVVKGLGSAIFLHIWLKEGATTQGCVAIEERELIRILQWLDPKKKPMILMGTRACISETAGIVLPGP